MTRTSRFSTLLSRSQKGHLRATRKKLASRRMMLENLEGRCVLSSISGIVFDDANGNGSQDGGELPLAGFTVIHETDGNSILDAGEDSAVTGADGTFSIPDLPPGDYTVAVWHETLGEHTAPLHLGASSKETLDFKF